jgi:hypothetical protein
MVTPFLRSTTWVGVVTDESANEKGQQQEQGQHQEYKSCMLGGLK